MSYTAAVITVSDKGARGERVDTSGPALVEMLKNRGFDVIYTKIVPDEKDDIKAELINCADELNISLVLTTGGTGFARRDITPEATMEVVERETPGIPELMRAESMKITNRACLSRSKAGIRKNTLIINLPGSEKAAKENFTAVSDALKHGMDMLASVGSADCAAPMQPSGATVRQDLHEEVKKEKSHINLGKLFKTQAYKQHNVGGESQLFFDLAAEGFGEDAETETNTDAVEAAASDINTDGNELDGMLNEIMGDDAVATAEESVFIPEAKAEEHIRTGADPEDLKAEPKDALSSFFRKKEYLPVPDDALVKGQIYNGKKLPPRVDQWLHEAKQDANAKKCGMYLTHNGIVREDAKSKVREGDPDAVPVTGMRFSYDAKAVREAIENAYQMQGIYYVKVWLNEGDLDVGDDIMYVLIGGDIRPNVVRCLEELVGTIKKVCVDEIELY